MNKPRLTSPSLVDSSVRLPAYTPDKHGVGIAHLGAGAFHRAHQAVMTDDALGHSGGDWRIIGINLRSEDIALQLNAQNGLYTVLERADTATSARLIASIDHVVAVDTAAILGVLCKPEVRIVTLTVTEAGYAINQDTRLPDASNSIIAADIEQPDKPTGVLGLLVAAISRRRTANHPVFTVLSCDNLPENGRLLHDGIVGFARAAYGDELADWIAQNIAFPCSMVDRITPASNDATYRDAVQLTGCEDKAAVETEPFIQWIIEDQFPSGRPAWEAGGALFVNDVTPYERMKLTMLNGCHSMLAYSGFLAGKHYVRDVMQDEHLSVLVQRHFAAASALLDPLPGFEKNDYIAALTARFANPAIAHQSFQIASDGSQKMPQRIFQPAIEALEKNQSVRPFAFATAMWIRFCLQRHDDGSQFELRDPRSDEISALIKRTESNAVDLVGAFHELPGLIPQRLCKSDQWQSAIVKILSDILASGCRAAIRHEVDDIRSLESGLETQCL